MKTKGEKEQAAYQQGRADGLRFGHLPIPIHCPYDSHTRIGMAWWSGFTVGVRERLRETLSGTGDGTDET